eukprot:Nitzschia sp. Nitz4//scaffold81_size91200//66688//69220//NITZ4_004996-RA/size91200-processed-gene-0.131-mRNA-1//-1//CDS//3329558740//1207//frame0
MVELAESEKAVTLPTEAERRESKHLASVKIGKVSTQSDRRLLESTAQKGVIWPWNKHYKTWWGLTVICAIVTVLTETYATAFSPAGLKPYGDALSITEYVLVAIFFCDIIVNFNLVYYDKHDNLVTGRKAIVLHYLKGMFWLDIAGVFPFYHVALAIAGEVGNESQLSRYLALLRLVKLVRLHRMMQLFEILQYNPHVSLMMLTLLRNFGFAILWSHFSACIFYFIARQHDFDPDNTWLGGSLEGLSGAERYITSLYWSVVTFTTVGYGDFSPVNEAEQIWGMVFMLMNMVVGAWMVGSITLLIVKQDEKTGAYRESIHTLKQYTLLHSLPSHLEKKLRTQLKLDFNNREISDEHVLQNFPSETRRKILRRLYLPSLMQTNLMAGVRQQFVDAFLSTCKVEIFSSGEEILQRGSISSDLYLLVAGSAVLAASSGASIESLATKATSSDFGGTSLGDSARENGPTQQLKCGEFINAVSFFTESPQVETIRTKSVCKTLTMPRATYKMLAADHPSSIGKVLQNLLTMAEENAAQMGETPKVDLPTRIAYLRAGSTFQPQQETNDESEEDFHKTMAAMNSLSTLTAVRDLVKMHMNKLKDDHTTRFLFAASRGDTDTISLMCEQGFDADAADYDQRTALMVAAMKGNTDAVETLLHYGAKPDLVDMHGTPALLEAVQNGHETTIKLLLDYGATLQIGESLAASKACQAVFDGDMVGLRRMLKAGLPVDAGDYDKRRAVHIASAEGNMAAVKLLFEFGANLNVEDRWGKTALDEAKRVGATQLVDWLNEHAAKVSATVTH